MQFAAQQKNITLSAWDKALELLARREHSRRELQTKLAARGISSAEIATTLNELAARGLQSDERFIAAFIASRTARGMGPIKIAAELRARGITTGQIEPFDLHGQKWNTVARMVRIKKFGARCPNNSTERAAQIRFLIQRGFTISHAHAAFFDQEES